MILNQPGWNNMTTSIPAARTIYCIIKYNIYIQYIYIWYIYILYDIHKRWSFDVICEIFEISKAAGFCEPKLKYPSTPWPQVSMRMAARRASPWVWGWWSRVGILLAKSQKKMKVVVRWYIQRSSSNQIISWDFHTLILRQKRGSHQSFLSTGNSHQLQRCRSQHVGGNECWLPSPTMMIKRKDTHTHKLLFILLFNKILTFNSETWIY